MTASNGTSPPCDARSYRRYQHPRLPLCEARGAHFCPTRAQYVGAFFQHVLVHVKGRHARAPFTLADWQREEIIYPVFGRVTWNAERERYIRQTRSGWLELARKNGKSELLAGVALYMLLADGEEQAQVYGAAKDRDQARIIWDVAARMVELSPVLSQRKGIMIRRHEKRIVDYRTGSYYTTLAHDAMGNLGYDPNCVVFDEVLAQPDDKLWHAMRTSVGSREEPLIMAATTAGNDPQSFAADEHSACVRVAEQPELSPHRFVYIRNTPVEADPWDENNWRHANPALGDFLSIDALRDEAAEAKADPNKENAFRQFRLNQWVSQSTRWMPMDLYRNCTGDIWPNPDWAVVGGAVPFAGKDVWVGLDLSAKLDLTSMAIFVPPEGTTPGHMMWRHWIPEDSLSVLDNATQHKASQWVKQGWLSLMEGAVIDYQELCDQIRKLLGPYRVREICYDKWSGEYVRQELQRHMGRRMNLVANEPTFAGMTIPMRELMNLTISEQWNHHGDPVAGFCFDSVEVKRAVDNPELIRPIKPERANRAVRIDAVVTAALAVGAWYLRGRSQRRGQVAAF